MKFLNDRLYCVNCVHYEPPIESTVNGGSDLFALDKFRRVRDESTETEFTVI
jgi:hypothetical protein